MMRFQLNSLFESEGGKKQIKIRNFQALIDDNYNQNSKASNSSNNLMFSSNNGQSKNQSGSHFGFSSGASQF